MSPEAARGVPKCSDACRSCPDVSRGPYRLGGAVGDGIDFDEGNGLVQPAQTGLVDVLSGLAMLEDGYAAHCWSWFFSSLMA